MYGCGHCGDIAATNYLTVNECAMFHCPGCVVPCRFDHDDTGDDDDLVWLFGEPFDPFYLED